MFEHKHAPVVSPKHFTLRMVYWLVITIVFLGISLFMGACGYHYLESMPWIDAVLNAAMILGGMGPVDALHTDAGKIFASFYALYCGIFLIVCGGILLVPIFHRVLHRFHADK